MSLSSQSADAEFSFHLLKGKESVLRMHLVIAELSARCDQIGAMDHISLFLNSSMNQKKVPFLVLASKRMSTDPFSLGAEDLIGAAVVYEYEVLGRSTKVFVTDDGSGSRTVIAAPSMRSTVTIKVCEHLIQSGARAALLSYKEEVNPQPQDSEIARLAVRNGTIWGSQVRNMSTYLTIQPTFVGTLAQLGRHTRRNLRYYRRRGEVELGAQFFPEARAAISKAEFCKLNRISTHPVEERAMAERYENLSSFQDSFCMGVRAADDRWLSLMGGRRHHGWTEVDWQVNRAGMDRLSLGTVMRSYFLEHEVALGTTRLYFEGGTPHTMRHSLQTEKAVDIVALHPSWRVRLMRAFAGSSLGKKNFLLQTLANTSINWQQL